MSPLSSSPCYNQVSRLFWSRSLLRSLYSPTSFISTPSSIICERSSCLQMPPYLWIRSGITTFSKIVASMTSGSRCISITRVFIAQICSVRSINSQLWTLAGSILYIFATADARVAQTAQYNCFDKDGSRHPWKFPKRHSHSIFSTHFIWSTCKRKHPSTTF